MGTSKNGRYLNTKGSGRSVSDFALVHSDEGKYTKPSRKGDKLRLVSGGHGQTGMDQLDKYGIKYNVEKTYIATINGLIKREEIRKLERGVMLEDGKTAPAKVRVISADAKKGKSIVSLTIHEGRNRQVRRMFEAIGYRVSKLKREQFGFLTTYGLNAGDWRELTPHEVKQLRALAQTGKIGK